MQYGLIGEKLGHSFSKEIHELLAGYQYELRPLSRAEFPAFMQQADFAAINVTIPYKELVIPYLAEVDEQAAKIGAVNTIVKRDGCLCGYNTDFAGVVYLLKNHGIDLNGRNVLILGTGGTSKTVRAVAESQGAAAISFVSRNGGQQANWLDYQQAAAQRNKKIIITAVIYNPLRSNLVLQAQALGLQACGGLEMLVAQAKYAAELFCGQPIAEAAIDEVYRRLRRQKLNLALIGMPGCGKSTVGRLLAERLGRPLLDCDKEIVRRSGQAIADIFAEQGEAKFRQIESQTLADIAKEGGQVIACGGGVVLRPENIQALRQNSLLIWLDRPLEQLAVGKGRPLSPNPEANRLLYQQRAPLYQQYADYRQACAQTPAETVELLVEYWQTI